MTRKSKSNTAPAATSVKGFVLHLADPDRLGKVRAVFNARGLPQLSLAMMVKIALDEWLKDQAGK